MFTFRLKSACIAAFSYFPRCCHCCRRYDKQVLFFFAEHYAKIQPQALLCRSKQIFLKKNTAKKSRTYMYICTMEKLSKFNQIGVAYSVQKKLEKKKRKSERNLTNIYLVSSFFFLSLRKQIKDLRHI